MHSSPPSRSLSKGFRDAENSCTLATSSCPWDSTVIPNVTDKLPSTIKPPNKDTDCRYPTGHPAAQPGYGMAEQKGQNGGGNENNNQQFKIAEQLHKSPAAGKKQQKSNQDTVG